jgi:ubiquinone/menaquinone biosynthesis C-methylase UbiE
MKLRRFTSRMRRLPAATLLGLAFTLCIVSAQGQDDAVDTRRLTELLELREGSTVADIGAGSGPLTIRVAQRVGPSGRVFSTDVNPERLTEIREAVAKAGLSNVTVVQGGSDETGLPDDCCDAIFMRLVYHHFADPPRMNASILRSVRKGGRVVVVDFPPKSGETAPPGKRGSGDAHGVTAAVVIRELTDAGFMDVSEVPWAKPGFAVLAHRPR